jgi:hypothetical protein
MAPPSWREPLYHFVIAFVCLAAFPRLSYRLRWPTRLGPRGLVAYIAFNTAVGFAMRTCALPYVKRIAETQERAREELRRELGREPTDEELLAHLGVTCER